VGNADRVPGRPRDTRLALLDAGVELLRELSPAQLVTALRTREIARRAGVSPPAFYHHFRTVDEYAQALVEQVFSTSGPRQLHGLVTESLREAQERRLPAEQSIDYHTRDLHKAAADPDLRLRLGLWALGGKAADDAYRIFLEEVDRQLLPQAQALHDLWGREARPPLDARSYLAMQIATLNGAAIRHLVDPSVMTPERYARSAAALSMVLLRQTGDRRTMDDRLSEMNWYATPRGAAAGPTTRRDATRLRILEAAEELFDEYGYNAASITQIAVAAGVHVATLYDHFASKAHLALTLLDARAADRLTRRPGGSTSDPRTALREHLELVGELVARHSDLARIYLSTLALGDLPPGFDDTLVSTTAELVDRCAADDPERSARADHLTEHVLVATIGAAVRHPGDRLSDAVEAGMRFL
jgi:AcrR family transcriptional regulator